MICEIAHLVHPDTPGKRFMAVFTFKFDESYNHRTLVVGGWIAEERQWKKLEKRWQKALAYENRTLPEGRKISRYHAANMNAHDYEFRGWENEPYRQLRFTKKLFNIVGNEYMTAAAVGIDLKAFDELFPERKPTGAGIPYIICTTLLMVLLGDALEKEYPPDCRLALIHDHGDWDKDALQGYNQLVDDPSWEIRHRFVSITPLTWRDDVGLQSADLVAYEAMRLVDDELWTSRDMRISMKELLKKNDKIFAMYLNRDALLNLKKELDERNVKPENITIQEIRPNHDRSTEGFAQRPESGFERGESGQGRKAEV